ncbi:Bbp16 family capsid cement protein [Cronobacter dublinensis]
MYVDKQLEFSDGQAVTATAISTNVVDLNPAFNYNTGVDIGTGEDVYLVLQVDAAATAAGAATVQITLESSAAAGLTSSTVHFTSPTYQLADLTANKTLTAVKLPSGTYLRYLGVRYTVGTGPLTAGSFSAFITKDVSTWRAYNRNYVA